MPCDMTLYGADYCDAGTELVGGQCVLVQGTP